MIESINKHLTLAQDPSLPQVGDIWRDNHNGHLFVIETVGSVYAGGAVGKGYQGTTYWASGYGYICLELTVPRRSFKEELREGRWSRLRNYEVETSNLIAQGLITLACPKKPEQPKQSTPAPEKPAVDPLRRIVEECERHGLHPAITITSSNGWSLLSSTDATDAEALAKTLLDLGHWD